MSIKRRILVFLMCLGLLSTFYAYADDVVYSVDDASQLTETQTDSSIYAVADASQPTDTDPESSESPDVSEEQPEETESEPEDAAQEDNAPEEELSEEEISDEEVPLGILEDVGDFIEENIVQPVIQSVVYSEPSPEPEPTPEPVSEPEEDIIYGYDLVAIDEEAVPEAAAPNEHSDSMLAFVIFFAAAAIMIGYVFDSSSLQRKIYAAEDELAHEKYHHNKKP